MTAPAPASIDLHNTYPAGRLKAWIAWSMPAIFFLYEFMIRVTPGVIEGPLQDQFHTSPGMLGFQMSLYYYAYAPMQLVVGILLDRLGGRGPMSIAAMICAAGCLLFAVSGGLAGLGGARFLMGFGSAFAYVGTVYVAAIWFPGRRIALLSGVTAALGMLGAVSAEALLALLLELVTWRQAFDIFAVSAVVVAVLMWILVPKSPSWYLTQVSHAKETHGAGMLSGFKCVLKSRQTWLLAIVTALIYLPIGTFAALWGVRYLEVVMGFSATDSGPAVSMMFVGLGVVGPFIGWLSDVRCYRAIYLKIGTVVALLCSGGLLLLPSGYPWAVYVLLFLLGGSAGTIVVAFPLAMEHNPNHSRGTAMTFVNFLQMICAGLGQWLVGFLLDVSAGPGNDTHRLEPSDFRITFLILPCCLLVGAFIVFFLKDAPRRAPHELAIDSVALAD
ncbi:MAG: MFS transporter [Planctomycetota bacterium]|nr:MFS transporter [Planctomycetota bacterium]